MQTSAEVLSDFVDHTLSDLDVLTFYRCLNCNIQFLSFLAKSPCVLREWWHDGWRKHHNGGPCSALLHNVMSTHDSSRYCLSVLLQRLSWGSYWYSWQNNWQPWLWNLWSWSQIESSADKLLQTESKSDEFCRRLSLVKRIMFRCTGQNDQPARNDRRSTFKETVQV